MEQIIGKREIMETYPYSQGNFFVKKTGMKVLHNSQQLLGNLLKPVLAGPRVLF
jgi:hypothetical protein